MLAVLVLVTAAGVISYVMSGETEVGGRGVVARLRRYIPLQSVKIIVVAWQILSQVRSIEVDLDGRFGASRYTASLECIVSFQSIKNGLVCLLNRVSYPARAARHG